MFYTAKTPFWVKKLFWRKAWDMPRLPKAIYLTFDDGPHPVITPFVLDELNKYNAKATFFCIGKNVRANEPIYKRILEEGHAVGNHTFDHLNGWNTETGDYLANVLKAGEYINSDLFRPPYGKITPGQQKALRNLKDPFKIIMWSVLSGDFDQSITPEKCFRNVSDNVESGSVIVFHDSQKACERMQYALPVILKLFTERGYAFKKIEFNRT